jgi:hypothetical protein
MRTIDKTDVCDYVRYTKKKTYFSEVIENKGDKLTKFESKHPTKICFNKHEGGFSVTFLQEKEQ